MMTDTAPAKKYFSPVSFMDGLSKKQKDLRHEWIGRT